MSTIPLTSGQQALAVTTYQDERSRGVPRHNAETCAIIATAKASGRSAMQVRPLVLATLREFQHPNTVIYV